MIRHLEIDDHDLKTLLKEKAISFGGNIKLKIYGKLSCRSGKRMKRENRVFFSSEEVAIEKGFRPCGNCLKKEYQHWNGFIRKRN